MTTTLVMMANLVMTEPLVAEMTLRSGTAARREGTISLAHRPGRAPPPLNGRERVHPPIPVLPLMPSGPLPARIGGAARAGALRWPQRAPAPGRLSRVSSQVAAPPLGLAVPLQGWEILPRLAALGVAHPRRLLARAALPAAPRSPRLRRAPGPAVSAPPAAPRQRVARGLPQTIVTASRCLAVPGLLPAIALRPLRRLAAAPSAATAAGPAAPL